MPFNLSFWYIEVLLYCKGDSVDKANSKSMILANEKFAYVLYQLFLLPPIIRFTNRIKWNPVGNIDLVLLYSYLDEYKLIIWLYL